jgi:hypothetical protein
MYIYVHMTRKKKIQQTNAMALYEYCVIYGWLVYICTNLLLWIFYMPARSLALYVYLPSLVI